MHIAVLHFAHETVTFLGNDTTLDDFIYSGSPAQGDAVLGLGAQSYMGGFVKAAREFDCVELAGIESPGWPRTHTGSGWVTDEAYETLVGRMIADLVRLGPFQGVYLSLHGAMAVRSVARPEAELARRVRSVVGPDVFIVGTFDPHGNQSEAFLRHADLAYAVKFYPHYDAYQQGERAARGLVRAIRGDYKPAHATIKVPIISPTVVQWTGASPWMDLVQRALVWEARAPDVVLNVYFGFPFADVVDVGMTIQVVTNGDSALATRIAEDMAQTAWRQRAALLGSAEVHLIPAGVALAKRALALGATPVVLADHSDRSGAATWLPHEIIAQDLSRCLIITVADAETTRALQAQGVKAGDPFDRSVGARVDVSAGDPVRITGTVLNVVEGYGQFWVVVGFGRGNVLVLSTYLVEITDPASVAGLGLKPEEFDVFAIKSRVHFRRGFHDSGFAKTILLVEPTQPFLGTVRLDGLPYRNAVLDRFYPYGEPPCP